MKTMLCRYCKKTFQDGREVFLRPETLERLKDQGSVTEGACENQSCVDADENMVPLSQEGKS